MELNLQLGYGMMEHSRHLLRAWSGGTVILSPRDLEPQQVLQLSADIRGIKKAGVIFDPQFYLPHADHERLRRHDYWPEQYDTGTFWSGNGLENLVDCLARLNTQLGCRSFILPGLLAETIDDDWLARQEAILGAAKRGTHGLPLLATLAIGADALRSQSQVHDLLEAAESWDPSGYYVVCEHPNGDYLVDDPSWLSNILDLLSGLRLRGRQVTLGYCTHQFLIAGLAKTTAIASGTWMNVRSFPPAKFYGAYDDEIKQRAIWYYCPQSLSEYKLPFLDLAYSQGFLQEMAPDPSLGSQYASNLFLGGQPTTVGLEEPSAFRHYLTSLHGQVATVGARSFDEAVANEEQRLEFARRLLTRLRGAGVLGQLRDFYGVIDATIAAIRAHTNTRGHQMRRHWDAL